MKSVRFLMAVILFVATWLAAIRSMSHPWNGVVYATMSAILATGTACGLLQRSRHRVFWVGFSAVGWMYWIEAFGPWQNIAHLLPTRMIEHAVVLRYRNFRHPIQNQLLFLSLHSIITLSFATVGGIAASFLAARREIKGDGESKGTEGILAVNSSIPFRL